MPLRALVASLSLHAGLAATIAVGGGAHAPSVGPAAAPLELVEIDARGEPPDVPLPASVAAPAARPTHTHPYPVPKDHDARPHDPSMPHAHADHAPPSAAAVSPAADEAPALPVFTIPRGASDMAAGSVRVAGGGDGTHAAASAGPAGGGATFDARDVGVPAKLASGAAATYPPDARADEIEGDVGLEIVVGEDGRVVDARVVVARGHGLDEAALAAVRAYRFSPARRDGRAVRVRMPWTVEFRLH